MNLILNNQNSPEMIKLLKASAAAYTIAKGGEIKITYFLLFLSVAYPLVYIFTNDDNLKQILFGCSFLITVLVQVFTSSFKSNTSKGAIFKEEFDTSLFNLPWKSTIKKPDHRQVAHYSQLYKGIESENWYSPNLSPTIPHNSAVAILQHTNTSWDIELRKKYRRWLSNFLLCYSITLFATFVIKRTDGLTIFLLLFSLLSFYTHFISLIRGHSGVIEKREAISKHLDEIVRIRRSIHTDELRDIQDEIYTTRQEPAKVPNFFFRWNQKQMNMEAEEYIQEVNELYNSE